MKNMTFSPNLTEQVEFFLYLARCMMLLLHCRVYSHVYCSLKFVSFGMTINCFGPVWSGQNIIGSVRGWAIKFIIFRSGPGWAKDNGEILG